jgi:hypothetical protein
MVFCLAGSERPERVGAGNRPVQSFNEFTFVSGGHVVFAFGGSRGFNGGGGWNFTSASNGIDLALQRFDLLLDGDDALELSRR